MSNHKNQSSNCNAVDMADQNESATPGQGIAQPHALSDVKGKGKATETEPQDVSMEGDESSSEEELDEVCGAMEIVFKVRRINV